MGSFFEGWRRKTGVVALLLGLTVMALWIRSFRIRDAIVGTLPGSIVVLKSFEGCLGYQRLYPDPDIVGGWTWTSETDLVCSITDPWFPLEIFKADEMQRNWSWADFHHGIAQRGDDYLEIWAFPYWSIVIPLTLLSAYLLLRKPRKSAETRISDIPANEGA